MSSRPDPAGHVPFFTVAVPTTIALIDETLESRVAAYALEGEDSVHLAEEARPVSKMFGDEHAWTEFHAIDIPLEHLTELARALLHRVESNRPVMHLRDVIDGVLSRAP